MEFMRTEGKKDDEVLGQEALSLAGKVVGCTQEPESRGLGEDVSMSSITTSRLFRSL